MYITRSAKRLLRWSVALLVFAPAWTLAQQAGGTYQEGWIASCGTQGSPFATCTHRLDATVMQPLAAIKWTADVTDLQPLLAESWEVEEDGRAILYHLREGVTWHDGEAFTADDVVFSFNTYANPAVGSRWASKLSNVEGYEAFQAGEADSLSGVTKVDDTTVRVALNEPMPLWPGLFGIYIVIFPEHLLGDVPPEELQSDPFWSNRVGTGPFKWSNYEPDQFIELVRFDDYFLGAPLLERIIYRFYTDSSTQLAALESGEIDAIAYETLLLPVTETARFETLPNLEVLADMSMGAPAFFRFNHTEPPFDDVRVRQAMLRAIDRAGLVEALWQGEAQVANTMFPQAWTWPEDLDAYAYDPDRARELLAEAGYADGLTLETDLLYYYGDSLTADLIVAIQQYLNDVGITLSPRQVDPPTIQEAQQDLSMQVGYVALGMGLDPSTGHPAVECGNVLAMGYCNEEMDARFQEALTVSSQEERTDIYQQIATTLNEELPSGWLWYQVRPLAFNTRVSGPLEHWREQPVILFNLPVYNEIETWYIK